MLSKGFKTLSTLIQYSTLRKVLLKGVNSISKMELNQLMIIIHVKIEVKKSEEYLLVHAK